jgi:N-acetylglucosamine-6-phosphate deacetylase
MIPEPDSVIIDAGWRPVGGSSCPDFIDTHFHGSGGDDVMAGGVEGLARISSVGLFGSGRPGFWRRRSPPATMS